MFCSAACWSYCTSWAIRSQGGKKKQWKAFTDLKDRITFKARSVPSDADEEGCGEGRQMHRGASVGSVSEMVPVSPSATESQTWSTCTAAKCTGCFNCYRWHREYCWCSTVYDRGGRHNCRRSNLSRFSPTFSSGQENSNTIERTVIACLFVGVIVMYVHNYSTVIIGVRQITGWGCLSVIIVSTSRAQTLTAAHSNRQGERTESLYCILLMTICCHLASAPHLIGKLKCLV